MENKTAKELWYVGMDKIVMETEKGEFKKFSLCPYRILTENDLEPLKGFNRKTVDKVPEMYWRFYGIERAMV